MNIQQSSFVQFCFNLCDNYFRFVWFTPDKRTCLDSYQSRNPLQKITWFNWFLLFTDSKGPRSVSSPTPGATIASALDSLMLRKPRPQKNMATAGSPKLAVLFEHRDKATNSRFSSESASIPRGGGGGMVGQHPGHRRDGGTQHQLWPGHGSLDTVSDSYFIYRMDILIIVCKGVINAGWVKCAIKRSLDLMPLIIQIWVR